MAYPRVEINLEKLEHNAKYLVDHCHKRKIQVAGVTKVFCADLKMAKTLVQAGVDYIADSRIGNLKKMKELTIPKMLLRLPMISEVEEVIIYSQISLNSELATISKLNEAAKKLDKEHKIILMCDIGDLREGIFDEEEVMDTVTAISTMEKIQLVGLGTNITCYGGIIPTIGTLNRLVALKEKVENTFNIHLELLSGGNSSSIHLMLEGKMPEAINHLRLGESIVLGRETAYGEPIPNTYDDCMLLKAEIIELKEKPSIPIGDIGMDAFGNQPQFIDKGIRKRAICAIGKQDVDLKDLIPTDNGVAILGGSSDHLILDVTECQTAYQVGDIMTYKLTYGSVLSLMTSEYVEKKYIY